MNPGFDSAFSNAEHLGNLAVGETFDVIEDDRHPERRRERVECFADVAREFGPECSVFWVARRAWQIITGGLTRFELVDSCTTAAIGTAAIERSVRRDPVDEGRKARLGTEAMPMSMQTQEGLLGEILRVFLAPHHAIEQAEDA